jgi:hypothetical protein
LKLGELVLLVVGGRELLASLIPRILFISTILAFNFGISDLAKYIKHLVITSSNRTIFRSSVNVPLIETMELTDRDVVAPGLNNLDGLDIVCE